jgi:DNA-binding Xre family transcriptional regulator
MAIKKRLKINIDKVIEMYNVKNSDKPDYKRMTSRRLAEMLGVSDQVVTNWNSDKVPTNKMVWHLDKLAEIGECRISDIITDEEETPNLIFSEVKISKKEDVWTATLQKTNKSHTTSEIVDIIHEDNFEKLLSEIGGKNWISLINKNK